jgi:hypothetical protein
MKMKQKEIWKNFCYLSTGKSTSSAVAVNQETQKTLHAITVEKLAISNEIVINFVN